MGALPAFDREKGFDGWRGFGVISLDRLQETARESSPTAGAQAVGSYRAAPPHGQDFSGMSSGVVLPFPPPAPVRAFSPDYVYGREEDSALLVTLAPHERNAFREIARTLGVHGESDEPRRGAQENAAHLDAGGADQEEDGEAAREPVGATPLTAQAEVAIGDKDALFDALPVGLAIRRQGDGPGVWLCANRKLLGWLGCKDNEAFLRAGGLDSFRRDGATQSDRGAVILQPQGGQSFPVDVETATLIWGGAPADALVFRRSSGNELLGRVAALEASLRQRETEAAEVMAILEASADGVVLFNSDGALLGLSASAEKIFGRTRDQIVGEDFTRLFARDSHARLSEALAQLKSGTGAPPPRDLTGLAASGDTLTMQARFLRLDEVSGKYCMVLRDLAASPRTEVGLASPPFSEKSSLPDTRFLLEAKMRAEADSRAKTEFLTVVSHEIRTPLNAILGFTEVIMDERFGPIGNARYKEYLKDIHASGAHVMSLVNDLLDLSKIEAGKLQLDFSAVDVNQLVSECVSLIQPQANRERVITRLALSPRLPPALADSRALRQIVLNLLANAVRYNEPGGQVIVSTAASKDGAVMLRVKDTGIGMTEAELRAALEPFHQASSRTKGGTGLGLPLTKALAEANHAQFVIRSRKNEGTLVEVSFPVAPGVQEAPTAEQAARAVEQSAR
jgi:PAS domain S-box-containing protein